MSEPIDIYCERTLPEFWAEPVNAITNLAFLIAAVFAYIYARQNDKASDPRILILISLVAVIGVGSFLFHTYAVFWAKLADVIPIVIYQILFIQFYAHKALRLSFGKSLTILGGFFVAIFIAGQFSYEILNGSLGYAPALLFLSILGILRLRHNPSDKTLLIAAGVFTLSLTFRSIDRDICEAFPLGTHFLWHVLNGVVLYLTTRGFVKASR